MNSSLPHAPGCTWELEKRGDMASLLDIFKETNGPNRQFVKGREGKEGGKEEGSKAKGLRGEKPCLLLPASLSPSFTSLPVIAPAFAPPSRVSPLSFRLRRCDLVRVVVGEV